MYRIKFLKSTLIALMLSLGLTATGQQVLNQLIIASGGSFSNPDDFVTLSSLDPLNFSQNTFGEIKTQAVQHVLVDNDFLYVAALDSIVKYDLNSFAKIASISISGPRMMLISGDLLFVSIQYPETENFIKIYNRISMEQISVVTEITGEAAGMVAWDNRIFVAVPGDWTSTVGKIAVLNALDGSFIEEFNLGEDGAGIHNLFKYNDLIVSVNRTPWGISTGSISFINPETLETEHSSFPHVINKGIAIHGNLLYLLIDDGIGSINLDTRQISQAVIVGDPGSANFTYFADVAFDTLSQSFFATTTDYFSFGEGHIFDLSGNQTGTFEAGISAESLVFDYRNISQVAEQKSEKLSVSPNPVSDKLCISYSNLHPTYKLSIINAVGQVVMNSYFDNGDGSNEVNVSFLKQGFYTLIYKDKDGSSMSTKFLKL